MSILRLDEGGIQPSELIVDFPSGAVVKNLPANAGDSRDVGSIPGSGRSLGVENGNAALVFLPGKFHEERSRMGCNPWGCKGSDTTERLN